MKQIVRRVHETNCINSLSVCIVVVVFSLSFSLFWCVLSFNRWYCDSGTDILNVNISDAVEPTEFFPRNASFEMMQDKSRFETDQKRQNKKWKRDLLFLIYLLTVERDAEMNGSFEIDQMQRWTIETME